MRWPYLKDTNRDIAVQIIVVEVLVYCHQRTTGRTTGGVPVNDKFSYSNIE